MNYGDELDKLIERAKARMDSDAELGRHCLPSPFDYLTDEEKDLAHWLKEQAPTMAEERKAARERVKRKIGGRKRGSNPKVSVDNEGHAKLDFDDKETRDWMKEQINQIKQ